MLEDGEDLLDVVGIVLVVLLVFGVVVAALAASSAPSRSDEGPSVDWRFERVDDTHLRVVHAGGDPMDPDNVVVTVGGVQRQVTFDGTVEQGDSVVVEVDEGDIVRVFWDAAEGERELLETHRVE